MSYASTQKFPEQQKCASPHCKKKKKKEKKYTIAFPCLLTDNAEDCREASRSVCLQLGYHRTEGTSRWFIFFLLPLHRAAFLHPASLAGLITWEKRRPPSERCKQGPAPEWPPLPFGDAPLPVPPKGIPKKLGFVVFSRPALLHSLAPRIRSFSHSRDGLPDPTLSVPGKAPEEGPCGCQLCARTGPAHTHGSASACRTPTSVMRGLPATISGSGTSDKTWKQAEILQEATHQANPDPNTVPRGLALERFI